MADGTEIEWADATVNAVNGCSVVSPGCTNCYAMRLAGTRLKHHPSRAGLTQDTKAGPVWNGAVRLSETQLLQPLRWRRPRRIFWNAHGDLFHEAVPDDWIDRVFAVCALTPQHTHMILTKRAARMREYFAGGRVIDRTLAAILTLLTSDYADGFDFPLPNVWLGVSVEDQTRADERIPDLLATPAAVRFISAEPLLGPVDLARWLNGTRLICEDCGDTNFVAPDEVSYIAQDGEATALCPRCGCLTQTAAEPHLDWVIAGGESGPNARPMHPDWALRIRDQCADAGVAFHFKQWGEWWPADRGAKCPSASPNDFVARDLGLGAFMLKVGKKHAGRLLDGVTHDGLPA